MSEKIRVVLPYKYDLVVGDTFQLFYRGIVEAPDPFFYDILAVCEKGKNFPRYFEFTPETEGKHKLAINVYNAKKELLGSAETLLDVALPKEPEENINILCIGDSLTAGGEWVEEACRRLASRGGNPEGLGYRNISFVGSCGEHNARYEGYGGWRWDSYSSDVTEDMWVVCDHNKTAADQHSVWEDNNGNLWKLETIVYENLKFIPYENRNIPKVTDGIIKHLKNAINKDDVVIKRTYSGRPSPFYDTESSGVNFKAYAQKHGIEKIDAVYILLGINGILSFGAAEEKCKEIVNDGKNIVDKIHRDFPDAKIKVMGYPLSSVNGGCGSNYGAVIPHCDDYGSVRFRMEMNLAYNTWAQEDSYRDFVDFINVSGQVDTDYAYPRIEKCVNIRSNCKEIIDINASHPSNEGYMQIADAAFRNMVHLCAEK